MLYIRISVFWWDEAESGVEKYEKENIWNICLYAVDYCCITSNECHEYRRKGGFDSEAPWLRFGFVRGEVTNIREEYFNGRLGYNCSASGVKITWYTYVFPLNFTIVRVDVPETDWFFVWDNRFVGILREGLIFGIFYSAGLWKMDINFI